MEAKEIGEAVKEFSEGLIRHALVDEGKGLTNEAKIRFIDWLGSALIMEGASIMVEAGAPPDVVLSRAVAVCTSRMKQQAQESVEASVKESLISEVISKPRIII